MKYVKERFIDIDTFDIEGNVDGIEYTAHATYGKYIGYKINRIYMLYNNKKYGYRYYEMEKIGRGRMPNALWDIIEKIAKEIYTINH